MSLTFFFLIEYDFPDTYLESYEKKFLIVASFEFNRMPSNEHNMLKKRFKVHFIYNFGKTYLHILKYFRKYFIWN